MFYSIITLNIWSSSLLLLSSEKKTIHRWKIKVPLFLTFSIISSLLNCNQNHNRQKNNMTSEATHHHQGVIIMRRRGARGEERVDPRIKLPLSFSSSSLSWMDARLNIHHKCVGLCSSSFFLVVLKRDYNFEKKVFKTVFIYVRVFVFWSAFGTLAIILHCSFKWTHKRLKQDKREARMMIL